MEIQKLYSKDEVIGYLEEIVKTIPYISVYPNAEFTKKVYTIQSLKDIVEKKGLPILNVSDNWYYAVAVTGRALYLNLQSDMHNQGSYNMIALKGNDLTIEQYAAMIGTTSVIVRKHILAGRLPYAFKAGTNWMIPEFSLPIKESELIGWFVVNGFSSDYIELPGDIFVQTGDSINISLSGRNLRNEKEYIITHNCKSRITKLKDVKKYKIGVEIKNKLITFLMNSPDIEYHSDDIGIGKWLYKQ